MTDAPFTFAAGTFSTDGRAPIDANSTDFTLTGPVAYDSDPYAPVDAIAARFPTAATSKPPTTAQRDAVATLQQGTRGLAELIVELVPDGPNREIALTSLEDVLMRSNRGVFVDGPR